MQAMHAFLTLLQLSGSAAEALVKCTAAIKAVFHA